MTEYKKGDQSYVKDVVFWISLGVTIAGGSVSLLVSNAVQDAKIDTNKERIIQLEKQNKEINQEMIRLFEKLDNNVTSRLDKMDGKIDKLMDRNLNNAHFLSD